MRRSEKEIRDKRAVEEIIRNSRVCRLGVCDKGEPYVVPVCFGYEDGCVFIHCADEGRKIDILKENPNCCVEFETGVEIVKGEKTCNWGVKFKSAIGFGKARFADDLIEKKKGLDAILNQYSDEKLAYSDEAAAKTTVITIRLEQLTGKQSG